MSALEQALSYARFGWRVHPTDGAKKYPIEKEWQLRASNDEQVIRDLFSAHQRDVAVITGKESGIFVLDVDPRHGGDETLADLETKFGRLPDTPEVITGSRGRHLYFKYPTDAVIRNNAATRLGPGLDIRGDGGQVSAPPTRHANGNSYEWDLSSHPDDVPVASAPDWLLDLLTSDPIVDAPRREKREVDTSNLLPGQRYDIDNDWADILEAAGATFVHRSWNDAEEFWSRPPKDNETFFTPHTGATLYYKGSDVLKVFTSEWEGLEQESTYTKFGFYAALYHGGDHEIAAATLGRAYAELEAEEFFDVLRANPSVDNRHLVDKIVEKTVEIRKEAEDRLSSWRPVSLLHVMDEKPEEPPSVGSRLDGVALLYRGKVHSIYGEPGGMKSWVGQKIALQTVQADENVLIIDFENSRRSVYDRFRSMGATRDDLQHIDIIKPEVPFGLEARGLVEALCVERKYSLILIDGTTDAMVLFGLEPEKNSDAATFDKAFLKPLAATGAAVAYVDHVAKSTETRGSWGFGAQHKKSALDGAAFGVEMIRSFGKGMNGMAKILVHKDKPGDLLQYCADGIHTCIAELWMNSDVNGDITSAIRPPSESETVNRASDTILDKVATFVEANPGLSKEAVMAGCGLSNLAPGKQNDALRRLKRDGYLVDDLGDKAAPGWRSIKKFIYIDYSLDQVPQVGELGGNAKKAVAKLEQAAQDLELKDPVQLLRGPVDLFADDEPETELETEPVAESPEERTGELLELPGGVREPTPATAKTSDPMAFFSPAIRESTKGGDL